MMNMLIAIMGDIFDRLMEDYEVFQISSKFSLLGDESNVMSTTDDK